MPDWLLTSKTAEKKRHMFTTVEPFLAQKINDIEKAGLFKRERLINGPQQAEIRVREGGTVLNLCANNYLGLANHPAVVEAARRALDEWGYGLASVRFICGTQTIHKKLEAKLSEFLGTEDTILYSSCFDANGGLFETLMEQEDAIISDELNHASIIDGIRLSKAARFRYKNSDMADLEAKLKEASGARNRLIATDGVFSMDGYVANLPAICDLAEKYNAMVMVDDSHAVGFMGRHGRGTHEHHNVMGRIDIITGTLGKALGGASGGYTSGRKEIVDLLRQRSRPYLFSNSVAPAIVAASIKVLESADRNLGIARETLREYQVVSRANRRAGLHHSARRTSDRPGDVGRRGIGYSRGRFAIEARGLRNRILLSCGAAGQSENPRAGIGRTHKRRT